MLMLLESGRSLRPCDVTYFLVLLVVVIRVLNFHMKCETELLITLCQAGLYNRDRLCELFSVFTQALKSSVIAIQYYSN